MERNLFSALTALSMDHLQGIGFNMPQLRFFTPNELFWPLLRQLADGARVFEVGAGNGELFHEAAANGVDLVECSDMIGREGVRHVVMRDATAMEFEPGSLVMCCRPSHSGWAGHAIDQALECGASFLYVGLRHNLPRDVDVHHLAADYYHHPEQIGEEGELVWGWGPLFQKLND